jgi:pullulanase
LIIFLFNGVNKGEAMYEEFGAVVNNKTVEFKLFIPDNNVDPFQYIRGGSPRIQKIQVAGDFQSSIGGSNFDLNDAPEMIKHNHPNGWLYTYKIPELSDGLYQYKYFVTFENGTNRWISDPCTKLSIGHEEYSAFIVGSHKIDALPIAHRQPLRNLILYELMIDDFTKEYREDGAPVDAVRERIDYLEELGINTVLFLPWIAWPGAGYSFGYDPFLFFSVEDQYIFDNSTPLDRVHKLKKLINELHSRNIGVIMEVSFSYATRGPNPGMGFPYYWLYKNLRNPHLSANLQEDFFLRTLILIIIVLSSLFSMFANTGSMNTSLMAFGLSTLRDITGKETMSMVLHD